MEMITLVIYDITDDDLRLRVAKFLKLMGLKRVQKSAFAGPLTSSKRADCIAGLKSLVRDAKANIQLYPLTEASFRQRVVIGVEMDYDEEESSSIIT
jgi:CRISPR-associated protein Cas2